MVQFLSIFFFLGFLQFLLGFSKVPVFLCHSVFPSVAYLALQNLSILSHKRHYFRGGGGWELFNVILSFDLLYNFLLTYFSF